MKPQKSRKEMQDMVKKKKSNFQVIRVTEGKEAENFPKLPKVMKLQIQDILQIPSRRPISRHIIIKN